MFSPSVAVARVADEDGLVVKIHKAAGSAGRNATIVATKSAAGRGGRASGGGMAGGYGRVGIGCRYRWRAGLWKPLWLLRTSGRSGYQRPSCSRRELLQPLVVSGCSSVHDDLEGHGRDVGRPGAQSSMCLSGGSTRQDHGLVP